MTTVRWCYAFLIAVFATVELVQQRKSGEWSVSQVPVGTFLRRSSLAKGALEDGWRLFYVHREGGKALYVPMAWRRSVERPTRKNFVGEGAFSRCYRVQLGGQRLVLKQLLSRRKEPTVPAEFLVGRRLLGSPAVNKHVAIVVNEDGAIGGFLVEECNRSSVVDFVNSERNPAAATVSQIPGQLEEVAKALHAMHLIGLLHRDLRPENVLVDIRGGLVRLRVADLGMASVATETGTLGGSFSETPWYPPERFDLGERVAKTRPTVDWFGFGLVLWTFSQWSPSLALSVGPLAKALTVRDWRFRPSTKYVAAYFQLLKRTQVPRRREKNFSLQEFDFYDRSHGARAAPEFCILRRDRRTCSKMTRLGASYWNTIISAPVGAALHYEICVDGRRRHSETVAIAASEVYRIPKDRSIWIKAPFTNYERVRYERGDVVLLKRNSRQQVEVSMYESETEADPISRGVFEESDTQLIASFLDEHFK